jgi:hypothetical protein
MTATVQKLHDGPRNAVFHIVGLGATVAQPVVTVTNLAGNPSAVRVDKIDVSSAGNGLKVNMAWDATSDVVFSHIGANDIGCLDYTSIGGLQNNAGAGKTGNINLTASGDTMGVYSITLHCVKKY